MYAEVGRNVPMPSSRTSPSSISLTIAATRFSEVEISGCAERASGCIAVLQDALEMLPGRGRSEDVTLQVILRFLAARAIQVACDVHHVDRIVRITARRVRAAGRLDDGVDHERDQARSALRVADLFRRRDALGGYDRDLGGHGELAVDAVLAAEPGVPLLVRHGDVDHRD